VLTVIGERDDHDTLTRLFLDPPILTMLLKRQLPGYIS